MVLEKKYENILENLFSRAYWAFSFDRPYMFLICGSEVIGEYLPAIGDNSLCFSIVVVWAIFPAEFSAEKNAEIIERCAKKILGIDILADTALGLPGYYPEKHLGLI